MSKLTHKVYKIKDIWLTISTLKRVSFFALLIYLILLVGMYLLQQGGEQLIEKIKNFSFIYGALFAVYFIKVFIVFSKGYVIDLNKEEFRFPAVDVENSLIDILTLKKYRDYARVKKIALKDISDIYIDTKRVKFFSSTTNKTTKIIYTLNIVGFHGSNNLDFSVRQKRDEVRGILVQAAKEVKVRIRDRRTAEFG